MADDIPEIRELACEPVLASSNGAQTTSARLRISRPRNELGSLNELGSRRLC